MLSLSFILGFDQKIYTFVKLTLDEFVAAKVNSRAQLFDVRELKIWLWKRAEIV